jgi:hypothetical protein
MRRFSCILGSLFTLGALAVAAWELFGRAPGQPFGLRPAGELWYRIDPGSLNLVQAVVERYIWPPLWDPAIIGLLQLPALVVSAVPAAALFALCFWRARRARRRRRLA